MDIYDALEYGPNYDDKMFEPEYYCSDNSSESAVADSEPQDDHFL